MAQINPSIPIVGQSDSTEDPKIVTALSTLIATINALDSANIVDKSIQAIDLAAPIMGQFAGTPLTGTAVLASTPAAATYWLGSGAVASGTSSTSPIPFVALGSGGYAVSGLTAMARIVCSVMVNNTAPAANFTFGLHGIATAGGGSSGITLSTAGALAGSTAAINAPAANAAVQVASADFAVPASGLYALAVVTSAQGAASSVVLVSAALQIHWV